MVDSQYLFLVHISPCKSGALGYENVFWYIIGCVMYKFMDQLIKCYISCNWCTSNLMKQLVYDFVTNILSKNMLFVIKQWYSVRFEWMYVHTGRSLT